VERETAVARKRVQHAETAIIQEVKVMTTAERVGATTIKPETRFEKRSNTIGDILSDLGIPDNEQDGEDEDDDEEEAELGKLSDDDEPGWVMGTMCRTVQYRIQSLRQKPMNLDELMQPGWGDAANYFIETDMKYGTAKLMVLAVLKYQIDTTAATPSPTTFGEHMLNLEIVSG
jgi:hypothetical protein